MSLNFTSDKHAPLPARVRWSSICSSSRASLPFASAHPLRHGDRAGVDILLPEDQAGIDVFYMETPQDAGESERACNLVMMCTMILESD